MRILLVEDDELQSKDIMLGLKKALPGCEVTLCETEFGFIGLLPELIKRPPDIIIMDVMLRFQNPGETDLNINPGQYYKAGLRCSNYLQQILPLCKVPIVFHTILGSKDLVKAGIRVLSAHERYAPKAQGHGPLLEAIQKLVVDKLPKI